MPTRAEAERQVRRGFFIHLAVYVLVVAGLAILNLSRNPGNPWFLWVLGGWGLGVLLHAVSLFLIPSQREQMIDRTLDRLNRSERRESD